MRVYLQLFFGLLIPLSALFIVVSILYFKVEYDFTKAIRLGVLTGIMLSLSVSFIASVFLQTKRLISSRALSPRKAKIKSYKHKTKKGKKSTTPTENEEETDPTSQNKTNRPISQKVMLLMNEELAFKVALNAITYHTLGKIKLNETTKGVINVEGKKGIKKIIVSATTRHTSQVEIHSDQNIKSIGKIIAYLKEREHSFLQY